MDRRAAQRKNRYRHPAWAAVWGMLFLIAVPGVRAADSPESSDVWTAFRPLLGTWQGEGTGFGSVSDVTHRWEFAVGGQFLRLRTRSVQRPEYGSGEVHEDVGYLSHDADKDRFVFRQFLSEGFVNTFDVKTEADGAVVFEHRDSESSGGMRVRMHIRFTAEDAYDAVLDLAPPGKDFVSCQEMHMKRTEDVDAPPEEDKGR